MLSGLLGGASSTDVKRMGVSPRPAIGPADVARAAKVGLLCVSAVAVGASMVAVAPEESVQVGVLVVLLVPAVLAMWLNALGRLPLGWAVAGMLAAGAALAYTVARGELTGLTVAGAVAVGCSVTGLSWLGSRRARRADAEQKAEGLLLRQDDGVKELEAENEWIARLKGQRPAGRERR